MGVYVNPGNQGFKEIDTPDYVDKTPLIALINESMTNGKKLTCISRPRRFGKSYAAKMLSAYYDCSCDSHALFDNKKISAIEGYEEHINKFNVIYLEITSFISEARINQLPITQVPRMIEEALWKDLVENGFEYVEGDTLNLFLLRCTEKKDGAPFVFIIDEWDAIIREAKDDPVAQKAFLDLLRSWFKNGIFTPKAVAAAYMTGILPIKKDGSQSAISDFEEYSMIDPLDFGEYVGFTEAEVKQLCSLRSVDFTMMKQWYDGYSFPGIGSVYNPNSVMKALRRRRFDSYWTETSAAEGLMEYISKDYHGLTMTIAALIGGVDVEVDTNGFSNDLTTFKGKDDVLTLLLHLGYLAYDAEHKTARIPNEEIKQEFQKSIHVVNHGATIQRLEESEKLFEDTIEGNEDAVAQQIEKVHAEETAAQHYNSENSLRSVIKLAYYTYRDHYLQFEELSSGIGYADIVYLPKHNSDWPALVIELKWNKSAEGAIKQIKERGYIDAIRDYGGEILLVGINYDKDAGKRQKHHTCVIEKLTV